MIDGISRTTSTAIVSRAVQNRPAIATQRQDSAGGNIYDFTNMSRKEFDSLWQNGNVPLKIPLLILPSEGLDLTKDTKAQLDAAYDKNIDFIGHFQKLIEHQKSLPNTDTNQQTLKLYEDTLNTLASLQGKAMELGIRIDV